MHVNIFCFVPLCIFHWYFMFGRRYFSLTLIDSYGGCQSHVDLCLCLVIKTDKFVVALISVSCY